MPRCYDGCAGRAAAAYPHAGYSYRWRGRRLAGLAGCCRRAACRAASAGADPGPAAYGRGDGLTVTDANVLLGRLPADLRLADQLSLDAERVRALFTDFARQLACSPEEAALGIADVETAMARALRHISVERGHDPNDFTLLSFGGAGGLHACALAQALGMRQALIPRYPGALSGPRASLRQFSVKPFARFPRGFFQLIPQKSGKN